MSVYILGANSFIASHLNPNYIRVKKKFSPNSQYDFCETLNKNDTIISCIGYCGEKNIDDCENNTYKTIESNTIIPTLLANEYHSLGIHFINIASGCIFNGGSPNWPRGTDYGWRETDNANPVSFYGKTKYATDLAISGLSNVCTVRIRMPLSSKPHSRNLINKLRNYSQIIAAPNSMTYLPDLSKCIDWMVENRKTGIYNVVNPEPLTAVQIMKEYQKYNPDYKFIKIAICELDKLTTAKRSNCLLDGSKLLSEGFQMTPSQQMLEDCMKLYVGK